MKKYLRYIYEFGFILFFTKVLLKLLKRNNKFRKYLINKKHEMILKKLYKENIDIITKYKNKSKIVRNGDNIWMLWWQGEEDAPGIVKNCIKSIKKYSNNVKILSQNNYSDYIELDDNIIKRFNQKYISIQTLSDIIRVKLLSKYGGFWVDATVFLTGDIFKDIKDLKFFTPKSQRDRIRNIAAGKWSIYFMGGKDVTLFSYLEECFFFYLKNHCVSIDYSLTDYLIELAYLNIDHVKVMIDNNKINNPSIYKLNSIKNDKYQESVINDLLKENEVHKLFSRETLNIDDKENVYNKFINV